MVPILIFARGGALLLYLPFGFAGGLVCGSLGTATAVKRFP